MLSPRQMVGLCKMGAVAADGRSKAFSADADGFGRGEGCGMVVLKRHGDALRDGDRVLAVLRGWAVNHDGHSNGLTVPNGLAQEALQRRALDHAGLRPADIDYVETHGTGTMLGDPIEAMAIAGTLCGARLRPAPENPESPPLFIGSVKTNFGHLEGAAGIASLMKAVLALQHGAIPPSLHFQPERANPHIPWEELPLRVPDRLLPWPVTARPGRAGVSSFGMSGTNVHVILEAVPPPPSAAEDQDPRLLCLSAKDEAALAALAAAYAGYCGQRQEVALADLCSGANGGRAHFNHRLALVAGSVAELRDRLAAASAQGTSRSQQRPRLAFLCSGQGTQYAGMGGGLYRARPVFRRALDRCAELLRPLGVDLLEVLYPGTGPGVLDLDQTGYTQPVLFSLEYALAELWRSFGVHPEFVMGHSVGEYVAACLAGVFSLEDGLRLVAARGRLMQALPAGGAMLAVMAGEERAAAAARGYPGRVEIATLNGPLNVVLAGERAALEEIAAALGAGGIKASWLKVSHAFHSPLMDPMLEAFSEVAESIRYAPPRLKLVSNLDGRIAGPEIAGPGYWVRHARRAVRFADGMTALRAAGADAFLEVGPRPVLLGMGRACLEDAETALWLPSLRPGQDDGRTLLDSLGSLYLHGLDPDWNGLDRDRGPRSRLALPTYPWQRQHHWLEPAAAKADTGLGTLFERRVDLPTHGETVFETEFSMARFPFLADHRVHGIVTAPGALQLALALSGAALAFAVPAGCLAGAAFPVPLVLVDDIPSRLQLILGPRAADGGADFRIISFVPGQNPVQPKIHAQGRWLPAEVPLRAAPPSLAEARAACTQELSAEAMDAALPASIVLGPNFRWLARAWRSEDCALARLSRPGAAARLAGCSLPPGLLDACFQTAGLARAAPDQGLTLLPFALDELRLHRALPEGDAWCYAKRREGRSWDLALFDEAGGTVAELHGFVLREAGPEAVGAAPWRDWLYRLDWQPLPLFGLPPLALEESRLPGLRQLAREWLDSPEVRRHRAAVDALEQLCPGYALNAFAELGACFAPGERLSASGLVARLGIAPRYERLTHRLLGMLAETGLLAGDGTDWRVAAPWPEAADPAPGLRALREQYGDLAEFDLLGSCGERLAACLRGLQDPLELLFGGGAAGAANRLYREAPDNRAMNHLVRQALRGFVAQLPETRGLRVLEVGGGTGDTSAWLLPELPAERTEYVFTDLGAAFLAQARQNFAEYGFVSCRPLDIEHPPAEQGFAEGQYDLVIAANVLHATRSLPDALRHVRQLLAPGGTLLLYEVTSRWRWTDLSFGLTDGWWCYADQRAGHPLLSPEQWRALLPSCGFAKVEALPEGQGLGQSVFLAQADAAGPNRAGTGWLLFGEGCDWLDPLAQWLEQRGAATLRATWGERYQRTGAGRWTLRAGSVEDCRRLLAEAPELAGVVYLAGPASEPPGLDWEGGARRSCGAALAMVQALLAEVPSAPPRLWLVSRDAQAVTADDRVSGVEQAGLWGLGRVVALEHPELRCVLLDAEGRAAPEAVAAWLAAELSAETGGSPETQLALRGACRYVPRLRRYPPVPRVPTLEIQADASYLITGGLGGLGLCIARWLAEQGAGHLVLTGRRPPGEAARHALDGLRGLGAKLTVAQADAGDPARMAAVLEAIPPGLPLRGVVHSAGALQDAALAHQDWASFLKVLRPKAAGAWNLHRLTQGLPLDFFVLFSSMAGLLGNRGQANHAAANAFLDAFAAYRRARGLPGLSVAWGGWSEVGAAAAMLRQEGTRLAALGQGVIPPEQGVQAFAELLQADAPPLVGVVPIDWRRFDTSATWCADLRPQAETRVPSTAPGMEGNVLAWLDSLAPVARATELVGYLRSQVEAILGGSLADAAQPLNRLGLDSLMSIDLRGRVSRDLGITLPVTRYLDASLASLVLALAGAWPSQAPAEDAAVIPRLPRDGGDLPLSFIQEEVWWRSQSPELRGVYNLSTRIVLEGRLDAGALRQALRALAERHECLRTVFPAVDGQPVARVVPAAALAELDLRGLPEAGRAAELDRLVEAEDAYDFDLALGPLLRFSLACLGGEQHCLVMSTHHILVDAWSVNLLMRELGECYAAVLEGRASQLPPLPIEYADFAAWQRRWHTPEYLMSEAQYWRNLMDDPPPPLRLPTDYPRLDEAGDKTRPAGAHWIELPETLVNALKALAQAHGTTLYVVLLSSYAALLRKRSGNDRILIGTPTSKRTHPLLESMAGHFAGRSWLHLRTGSAATFAELLAHVREVVLAAIEHQALTLRQWLRATEGHRDWRPAVPLHAEAVFNLLPPLDSAIALPGLTMASAPREYLVVNADMSLTLWEDQKAGASGLRGFWTYRVDLFKPTTIAGMTLEWQDYLETVAANPDLPV